MTGVYPLPLCVLALEKCKDDIQFAANWLFENGAKEMERMENEYLNRTRQEEAELQERWERELLGTCRLFSFPSGLLNYSFSSTKRAWCGG